MNSRSPQRLLALDWMRGLVMLLMTLDHVSAIYNKDRISGDAYAHGAQGAALFKQSGSALDFMTRWVTHLCAPTFVFLAGTALALSVAKRRASGDSAWAIDRHLIARGVILIALEAWMSLGSRYPVSQVLYAIGASLLCMVLLRRLPSWALIAIALVWMGAGEWFTEFIGSQPSPSPTGLSLVAAWEGLWFTSGFAELGFTLPAFWWMPESAHFFALYPAIPWLAIMLLGWCFGRWIVERRDDPDLPRRASRLLLGGALLGLVVFLVQRLFDGYGNYWLPRGDDTLLRWLQVSKYPPSLAFYGLELGLMALLLAGFLRVRPDESKRNGPLTVFGQVALFYYVIHIHLLALVSWLWLGLDAEKPLDSAQSWLGAVIALLALYPVARGYRSLKRARPSGLLRFL